MAVKRMILAFLLLIQCPLISYADVVFLKNGQQIKTKRAWTEGEQVKCYRFGAVIGYPKDSVERIEKEAIKETPRPVKKTEKSSLKDLEGRLAEKRPPQNNIEKAGNGSVTVKTLMGAGSGFFITDDGYILTNRHVVETDDQGIEFLGKFLEKEKERLDSYKEELEAKGKFHRYEERYNEAVKKYEEKLYEYDMLKQKSYFAGVRISLVDDTEFKVKIIKISKNYDLALLKLDGYKTPFLEPANARLAQGDQLYAVGSPLNLGHSVSSGVFSGYRQGYLQTNVSINAGNSGGPMITKEGKVVGINTWKIVGSDIEGLSFSIPIETALKEFKELKGRYKQ